MVKLGDFGPLGQLGASLRAAADCLYSAPEVLRKVSQRSHAHMLANARRRLQTSALPPRHAAFALNVLPRFTLNWAEISSAPTRLRRVRTIGNNVA